MIIVLTGAPGAGKGTQAELLASRDGYRTFSTGQALRKHVQQGTEIGKQAGAIMARGELVPDDVLFQILKEELGPSSDEVILLDGYPRNIAQAETLASLGKTHPVKAAIQLDVPRTALIGRLSGRRVCSSCGATYHIDHNPPAKAGVCDKCGKQVVQRTDDNAESVARRLDVYEENTKPVLDYYRAQGLYKAVGGTGSTDEIYEELKGVIEAL